MKGIEKITARIAEEAEEESRKILEAADKRAGEIRAAYEEKAREEYEQRMSTGRKEADIKLQHRARLVRLDGRNGLLAVKMELIAQAYAKAREKILSMPEGDYVAFLAELAANNASTGSEEIIMNQADRSRAGAAVTAAANEKLAARGLNAGLKLSDSCRNIDGGLVLRQENIEVNCSLEAMFEMNRNTLDTETARILFR